jgi:hypothetical protein
MKTPRPLQHMRIAHELQPQFNRLNQQFAFRKAFRAWLDKLPDPHQMFVWDGLWFEDIGPFASITTLDDEEDAIREYLAKGNPMTSELTARQELIKKCRDGQQPNGEVYIRCAADEEVQP